jgi:hypothetical protein
MNLYDATVPLFTKSLKNVESWLDKAVAYAESKKADPERILTARLAIDQYALVQQIQSACDQAKFTVAKMTGKEPPAHPDTEKTLPELRARIHTVLGYLETFTRADFEGCEERVCTHSWMGGKGMRAGDYLDHLGLPNYYFHVTTAYSILRHLGVPLGKQDFLGSLPMN